MSATRRRLVRLSLTLPLLAAARPLLAADRDDAREVAERSLVTFNSMVRAPDYAALATGLRTARGVLIFPSVLKAGFFLGGSGGTGVLLARDGARWHGPAFYTMGAVSFGLQVGAQSSEVIILVNSAAAMDGLLTSSLKLGGNLSVAAGPVGTGVAQNVKADLVSYARAAGAFLGMSLEGAVLDVRDSLNNAYYGRAATPADILVRHSVTNTHGDALRAALAGAAR